MVWAYLAVVAVFVAGSTWQDGIGIVARHIRVDSNGELLSADAGWGGSAVKAVMALVFVAFCVACVGRQIRAYRRSAGEHRQQLKWLLSGGAFSIGGLILAITINNSGNPVLRALGFVGFVGVAALPLGLGIGILRYRLYEIDRLISRTLSYALLTGLLVGVFAGLVLLTTRVLPFSSPVGVAASTLAAAGLFSAPALAPATPRRPPLQPRPLRRRGHGRRLRRPPPRRRRRGHRPRRARRRGRPQPRARPRHRVGARGGAVTIPGRGGSSLPRSRSNRGQRSQTMRQCGAERGSALEVRDHALLPGRDRPVLPDRLRTLFDMKHGADGRHLEEPRRTPWPGVHPDGLSAAVLMLILVLLAWPKSRKLSGPRSCSQCSRLCRAFSRRVGYNHWVGRHVPPGERVDPARPLRPALAHLAWRRPEAREERVRRRPRLRRLRGAGGRSEFWGDPPPQLTPTSPRGNRRRHDALLQGGVGPRRSTISRRAVSWVLSRRPCSQVLSGG